MTSVLDIFRGNPSMRKGENYFKVGNVYRSVRTGEVLLVLKLNKRKGLVLIIAQNKEFWSNIYPPGCVTRRDLPISLWRHVDEH